MNYSIKYNLQPGDDVKESIFQTGLSKHHTIYLGVDPTGTEWVAENHKFVGVRLVKAQEYFSPAKNYIVVPFKGTLAQREIAVKRALSKVDAPYNLITYNCEHYASYVQTGCAQSKQVGNAVTTAITALLVLLFVKSVNSNSR